MSTATPTTQRVYRPGQPLFREGDHPKSLFLIKKGTVAVRKLKAGAYVELARIHSNEILGELSFFDRQPRSATAIAITEVEALEINFDSLDAVYDKVPDYMKSIIAGIVDRLRKANDIIRRLQKNVVENASSEESASKDPEAKAVLAAAKEITGNEDKTETTEETNIKKTPPADTEKAPAQNPPKQEDAASPDKDSAIKQKKD